jgi:hypothetical protein
MAIRAAQIAALKEKDGRNNPWIINKRSFLTAGYSFETAGHATSLLIIAASITEYETVDSGWKLLYVLRRLNSDFLPLFQFCIGL